MIAHHPHTMTIRLSGFCRTSPTLPPDDTRVPMFQQQALAALSGEDANISDGFQTRCCIWSFED